MTSRRPELLSTALEMFTHNGFAATPVSAIVEEVGMSKAAFTYHFESKESLLVELATPLLDALDDSLAGTDEARWPEGVRSLLSAYLDALVTHRPVAMWLDGDKSVLGHPLVGQRLERNNARMRLLIAGDTSEEAEVAASAALGALWRPIRNLTETNLATHRNEIIDAAMAAAAVYRADWETVRAEATDRLG